ncbi:hypothetical protein RFI_03690 [Reticulomyxa filosa]|uniref:G-protein coupled receptors family 3 profile domain-containing protein n=1 Tax=Reticulomyxa filosa TaxID=46433 RepID=X6P4G4_RETFI|nr:hypothetical protein RFI_03690 [Reticulomyxa filosa]|eukprot:ETO33415.1 hypothetical protein RFI_03690 [Reticulomyxa filosa]
MYVYVKNVDLNVSVRVTILLAIVWLLLAIFFAFNPFTLTDSVYQHRMYQTCHSNNFVVLQDTLYAFYGLGFLYIGKIYLSLSYFDASYTDAIILYIMTKEWHHRSSGKVAKYNDSKWVAIISWNVILGIALVIFFSTVDFSNSTIPFRAISAAQLVVTAMNMPLYILPKIARIIGKKRREDLSKTIQTSNTSDTEPSKSATGNWKYLVLDRTNKDNLLEDVRLIKEYLEPFGYQITSRSQPASKPSSSMPHFVLFACLTCTANGKNKYCFVTDLDQNMEATSTQTEMTQTQL